LEFERISTLAIKDRKSTLPSHDLGGISCSFKPSKKAPNTRTLRKMQVYASSVYSESILQI